MDCPRVGYENLKAAAASDLEARGYKCSNEAVFTELTDKVSKWDTIQCMEGFIALVYLMFMKRSMMLSKRYGLRYCSCMI